MRRLTCIFLLALLVSPSAEAKLTKADCKAHAGDIKSLTERLGLSPETTGRELLNKVESWIEGQDKETLEEVIREIEAATDGIEQCEAGGYSNAVQSAKALSTKLKSAVLPWLRNTTAVDPCRSLISEAARKKANDLDGAIQDLERSVSECKEQEWLPEAHRQLVALYYERGDVEKNDYRKAHDLTRRALELGQGRGEADRKTYSAILAKSTLEAGQRLMEQRAYEQARPHWEAYIDTFGTADLDVLFDVEEVAQGSWSLRELVNATYQLALTCLELGDVACVRDSMPTPAPDNGDDAQPIRQLTIRALELAPASAEDRKQSFFLLALDLLSTWHELAPDSYQINQLLKKTFLDQPPEVRLELLRMTKHCWIPLRVAEALRQDDQDYIAETQIAAACGGSGAEAQQILTEFYVQAAYDKLDRLGVTARSAQARRALLDEVERELLPKIESSSDLDDLKARIAAERANVREEINTAHQEKVRMYSGCMELLATIQWNRAREEEYDREERDFKQGCCGFLMANADGWAEWMRSRPEKERLEDAEIENKSRLMKEYCESSSD